MLSELAAVNAAPFSSWSVTGLAAPSRTSPVLSSVTPSPDITSVPPESIVVPPRLCESINVPGPVFSSEPATGTFTAADTPDATSICGATNVAEEPSAAFTVALAWKSSLTAVTLPSTVATSPAFANTALLLSCHAAAAPSTFHFSPSVHPPPFGPSFQT